MKRQAGFTIIELLIVVTILAMLAGILVFSMVTTTMGIQGVWSLIRDSFAG